MKIKKEIRKYPERFEVLLSSDKWGECSLLLSWEDKYKVLNLNWNQIFLDNEIYLIQYINKYCIEASLIEIIRRKVIND